MENAQENYTTEGINRHESASSSFMNNFEKILDTAKEQYADYRENGGDKLWQQKNPGIVECVIEAKGLLDEHGSSQIIETKIENEEIETKKDSLRVLAFARLLELDKKYEN